MRTVMVPCCALPDGSGRLGVFDHRLRRVVPFPEPEWDATSTRVEVVGNCVEGAVIEAVGRWVLVRITERMDVWTLCPCGEAIRWIDGE